MVRNIDLRSDTVTKPSQEMRQFMMEAAVGDDVMKEDPTVKKLEKVCADLFGKEAALFVASGTMANQIAILTLCDSGDQIIVHDQSHIFNLEVSGLVCTCQVQPRAIPAPNGEYALSDLVDHIRPRAIQEAPTKLVCFENSFDLNRGLALPPETLQPAVRLAKEKNLQTYLDGARIFNTAVALKTDLDALCQDMDAVAFCLSKGLGCPIGSVLLGESGFIKEALRMRQRLGGGWRQAGILAAAGLYALENMIDRLETDHENAKFLADHLVKLGLQIEIDQVQTNIILINTEAIPTSAGEFCAKLEDLGVLAKPVRPQAVRMVTHYGIDRDDLLSVIETIKTCL